MKRKRRKLRGWVKNTLLFVAILGIAAIIRGTGIFRTSYVVGESMEPNYHSGDIVVSSKLLDIERYDVVIAESPTGNEVIKRVIGLPGDTMTYYKSHIYINGELADESFIASDAQAEDFPNKSSANKIVLGENEYYLAGDNRNFSTDSRVYGSLDDSKIIGRVID